MTIFPQFSSRFVFSLTGRSTIALAIFACAVVVRAEGEVTPLTTLRHETRQLLRQEATLDEGDAKDAAITALCDLYVVIRSDDRYSSSEMLQGDAAKIRRRLLSTGRKRERTLKRQSIPRPSGLTSTVDAAIAKSLSKTAPLNNRIDRDPAGGAGGGAMDNGWQLVELIQRIIAPDFWDRQGGPGAIRYFAMRRVLVVRATTDVHQQIKDLLIALR